VRSNQVSEATITPPQSLDEVFLADDFFSNIHEYYRLLREQDPVHWSGSLGYWILTSYADVHDILRDPRLSSAGRVSKLLDRVCDGSPPAELSPLVEHYSGGLIHSDPPVHTRLRKLFNKPFVRPAIEAMRPRVQERIDELIDGMAAKETVDLVRDFAFPLPITVVCDLLGIDIADRDSFLVWSHDLSDITAAAPTVEGMLRKQESLLQLRAMIGATLAERRKKPGSDMFSALLAARDEEDALTEEEIIQSSITVIIGAHETTTSLISNAILGLLRWPNELAKLRERPELVPTAVEEFLRFECPLNHNSRVATADLEIQGRRIEAGQVVVVSLVAANRDPRQFSEPDRLDVERRENPHLAFGFGSHFCLGAPLARLEAQLAIESLLRRFERFELISEPPWRRNVMMHGVEALELALHP
jgi:pimeloyl-[acyl-carrier protein] synthase